MHAGRVGKVHKKPSVIAKTARVTIRSVIAVNRLIIKILFLILVQKFKELEAEVN